MKNANIMTFDVEDWFHILDLPRSSYIQDINNFRPRVEPIIDRILTLLSSHDISSTFFVLGSIAEKYPNIIRKIDYFGHEIASHGYGHELIYAQGPERFRQDIAKGKSILEDLTGSKVLGYRGPGFSITRKNLWAFDIIAEEGFEYDATLYPGKHSHGGIPNLPSDPFILLTLGGHDLEEYPSTVIGLKRARIAFAGGGYFRFFPYHVISTCIKWLNRKGYPVVSYLHPRDFDPDTPRLPMPWKRRFKCYVNLSCTYGKLDKILSTHAFTSIRDWREGRKNSLFRLSL